MYVVSFITCHHTVHIIYNMYDTCWLRVNAGLRVVKNLMHMRCRYRLLHLYKFRIKFNCITSITITDVQVQLFVPKVYVVFCEYMTQVCDITLMLI